jgi:hypothetical protein
VKGSEFTFDPLSMAVIIRQVLQAAGTCGWSCPNIPMMEFSTVSNIRVLACEKCAPAIAVTKPVERKDAKVLRRLMAWAETLEREAKEKL